MAKESNTPRRRRTRSTGTVYQRGRRFVARIEAGTTPNGRRKFLTKSYATEAEAKRGWQELVRDTDKRLALQADDGKGKTTVEQWIALWLELKASDGRPSSVRNDRSSTRRIITTIGKRRLADLTPADFRAVIRATEAAGVTQTTVFNQASAYRRIMRAAVHEGYTVPRSAESPKMPGAGDSPRRSLTPQEVELALREIENCPIASKSRWLMALWTAARSGEVLGVTWDRIHLEDELSWVLFDRQMQMVNRTVIVPYQFTPTYVDDRTNWAWVPTKSSLIKRVPLAEPLRQALIELRGQWVPNAANLVFARTSGLPRLPEDDRDEWRAIQKAAGIERTPGVPFVVHEFRHTTATLLASVGVAPEVIRAIVGHTSEAATAVYTHTSLETASDGLNQLLGMFEHGKRS